MQQQVEWQHQDATAKQNIVFLLNLQNCQFKKQQIRSNNVPGHNGNNMPETPRKCFHLVDNMKFTLSLVFASSGPKQLLK